MTCWPGSCSFIIHDTELLVFGSDADTMVVIVCWWWAGNPCSGDDDVDDDWWWCPGRIPGVVTTKYGDGV
jgi:hypothetical protein